MRIPDSLSLALWFKPIYGIDCRTVVYLAMVVVVVCIVAVISCRQINRHNVREMNIVHINSITSYRDSQILQAYSLTVYSREAMSIGLSFIDLSTLHELPYEINKTMDSCDDEFFFWTSTDYTRYSWFTGIWKTHLYLLVFPDGSVAIQKKLKNMDDIKISPLFGNDEKTRENLEWSNSWSISPSISLHPNLKFGTQIGLGGRKGGHPVFSLAQSESGRKFCLTLSLETLNNLYE